MIDGAMSTQARGSQRKNGKAARTPTKPTMRRMRQRRGAVLGVSIRFRRNRLAFMTLSPRTPDQDRLSTRARYVAKNLVRGVTEV